MLRSIRTKLVVVYLLLLLFALELIGAYVVRTLTGHLLQNETSTVQNQAQLLATIAAPAVAKAQQKNGQGFSSVLSSFPHTLSGAVYLLSPQGVVLDTSAGPALIGQKRTDSIATEALLTHSKADAIRYDAATSQHVLVMAVPIRDAGHFVGLVEYAVGIQNTYDTVRQVTTIFYSGSAVVLFFTALLGILLARTFTQPVLDVTRQARTMAAGDFSNRVKVRSDDELGELGNAINNLTEHLEDALAANVQEQEKLNSVIENMGDAVLVFEANEELTLANDAAQRLWPLECGSLQAAGHWLHLMERMKGQMDGVFVESLGESLVHVHITVMRRQSEIQGYIAVLRDVTEQEKLNHARRDFVANVSHELRTPLTTIKSYIEALQDNLEDQSVRENFLEVIAQETNRMVRLTQDLLQLSGLDHKSAPFRLERIHLHTCLEEAHTRFELQSKSQGITFDKDIQADVTIEGDRDLVHRLLDNLLGNALKYTPSGGSVWLSSYVKGSNARIEVRDNGMGIPPEDVPHVFERFYRVEKARSRRKGGSGLGLALAREITERHGGTIAIESEVNNGTCVIVTLPLAEVDEV